MVGKVTAKTFEEKVLNADKPVVVDVWAEWCGPCRMQGPIFSKASKQFEGKAYFYKLDSDKNQELVKSFRIMGIPTMLYFAHGKLVDKKTGVQNETAIAKRLEPLFGVSAEEADQRANAGFFTKLKRMFSA